MVVELIYVLFSNFRQVIKDIKYFCQKCLMALKGSKYEKKDLQTIRSAEMQI